MLAVCCAIIQQDDLFLVAQRGPNQLLPLKWEFPGGKIEQGETPEQALIRECEEELGVQVAIVRALTPVSFSYPTFSIVLHPYRVNLLQGDPVALEHAQLKWVTATELPLMDWAEADLPIVRELLQEVSHP